MMETAPHWGDETPGLMISAKGVFIDMGLDNNKPVRCDYHVGDTAAFLGYCYEMHINCDNSCQQNEFYNRFNYDHYFAQVANSSPGLIDRLFGCKLPISRKNIPTKIKYFIIRGDEKVENSDYFGLTTEQIHIVEEFKRRWGIE